MKLKTIIKATDGRSSVSLIVESKSTASELTHHEQQHRHDCAVNNAHATLIGRFNVRQIKIT